MLDFEGLVVQTNSRSFDTAFLVRFFFVSVSFALGTFCSWQTTLGS